MTTHELKCWPEFFQAIVDGRKPFDARKNDRDFKSGDEIILKEFAPTGPAAQHRGDYTGRQIIVVITYVLSGTASDKAEGGDTGGLFGVREGYCILGIRIKTDPKNMMDEARMTAAQCWCDKETEDRIMDVDLCEAVAKRICSWMDTAGMFSRNADYYRGLVVECGNAIGTEAFTADDGRIHDEVLCAKVPQLVKELAHFD